MATLKEVLKQVVPGRPAWHDVFHFGVFRELDGSLWVCDAHGSAAWKFPVADEDEALYVVGETTSDDLGWRLL